MVNQKFSVLIYFLSAILVLILSIFLYKIVTHIYYVYPYDKTGISKYTCEQTASINSSKIAKIATFSNTNNKTPIIGLNSADIVFEFLTKSNGITYKAVFSNEAAKNIESTINLKNYSNEHLPILNISANMKKAYIINKKATSIFVNFNEDITSNFLYEDGDYYHYRGLEVDKDNNTPVKLTNIIIQFMHGNIISDKTLASPVASGTGLLFSNGKAQDIKWNQAKNSQMKITDQKGAPISLVPGPIWWVFIDRDSSVAYD
ncbi:DUF3048 C-terminal domain-containing protein [Clostridium algoriphilum]|uniref:DUF3048 domain-containing protein n=1 Tax=Clostridium algoriphilum TaxID=198347 RepID=UPI001CF4789F|nr:DUF3048 C-terminal domain-containing protein [Clostridium algoriphilum]MCB2295090.1 DUF3048 C-terminal domain-containing protein [Clostridium algoriphilum]